MDKNLTGSISPDMEPAVLDSDGDKVILTQKINSLFCIQLYMT